MGVRLYGEIIRNRGFVRKIVVREDSIEKGGLKELKGRFLVEVVRRWL